MQFVKGFLRKLMSNSSPLVRAYLWKRLKAHGVVEVGAYSYGTPLVLLWDFETHLKIGKYCSIAEGVTFILGGQHRQDWISTYPFSEFKGKWSSEGIVGHPESKGDITIGNDVWIGFGATVLSGVKIYDGAVIGANATVTRDVPAYAVVAGNPARILKYRFSGEIINLLKELQWWNCPPETIDLYLKALCSVPDSQKLNHLKVALAFNGPKNVNWDFDEVKDAKSQN